MANNMNDYIVEFGEEIGKQSYSIVKAGVSTLYKAKGEVFSHAVSTYLNTRFEIRLEDFTYEQKKISKDTKKKFYTNIDERQLNFLFELLERSRTSTYDLHAKILARLYGNLILNGNLNYHESTFLANISILNDEDLVQFLKSVKESLKENGIDVTTAEIKKVEMKFKINTYTESYIYEKLVRVGLLIDAVNMNGGLKFQDKEFQDKAYFIHYFTREIFLFLDEISDEL